MKTVHFTLGPVQEFVAQARRTRDLWAGSFLLSFLSAQAMKVVLEAPDGQINFPDVGTAEKVTDPLLAATMGKPLEENPQPFIGSIPNRFKATVPDDFDAYQLDMAITRAWKGIADSVFDSFLRDFLEQYDPGAFASRKRLWDQQIAEFWDVNWVMGDASAKGDSQWLDQRKNWRTRCLSDQEGEKCSLMGDWQELSGYSVYDRKKRHEFWQALSQQTKGGARNIRDGEYLCAISLVKRLFPTLNRHSLKQVIQWVPGGNVQQLTNWPSTTYLSALPWLLSCYRDSEKHQALKSYLQLIVNEKAKRSDVQLMMSEQVSHFSELQQARTDGLRVRDPESQGSGNYFYPDDIDGDLFNIHSLANFRSTYLSVQAMTADSRSAASDPDQDLRKVLLEGLSELYSCLGEKGKKCQPRSYYALLIMDGDRLGALLRRYAQGEQQTANVSKPLRVFTRQVPQTVARHQGLTLYAGGDDVLAMLPLHSALACADALNQQYRAAFAAQGVDATASAAVLFVHHQYPLSNALQTAHALLDDVAKVENGRDSCVVAVLNQGGQHLQWVNAWNDWAAAISPDVGVAPATSNQVQALLELVAEFEKMQMPRGFFHKLKRQFPGFDLADLSTVSAMKQGHSDDPVITTLSKPKQLEKLFLAELLMSEQANVRPEQQDIARAKIQTYLKAARRISNALPSSSDQQDPPSQYTHHCVQFDAGLIARFLTRSDD